MWIIHSAYKMQYILVLDLAFRITRKFNDAVSAVDIIHFRKRWRSGYELARYNDSEECGRNLFEFAIPEFAWRNRKYLPNVGLSAKITVNFSKVQICHWISLTGVCCLAKRLTITFTLEFWFTIQDFKFEYKCQSGVDYTPSSNVFCEGIKTLF